MAGSDELQIVDLGIADIGGGMALSTEAGWNQTADDWCHFIERGKTIGVRDGDGRLIASAAVLPYIGPLGYIGMVLVTQRWRRQGIATRLVDRCIEALESQGLVPVLDATAAGEAVYARQGFLAQFRFDRWQGRGGGGGQANIGVDASTIVRLDAAAFGAARPNLMNDFIGRDDTQVILAEDGESFAMVRRGRRAWQAGPVVTAEEKTALQLIRRLMGTVSGSVFIDVPQRWRAIGQWLAGAGFTVQRSFARMALRRAEPFGDPSRLFAVAGPEFG